MIVAPWSAGDAPATLDLPPGSVDCHHHIYDTRYPYHPDADLRPPDATVAHYRQLQTRLGTKRSVIVQPSSYGTDNTCLCDALQAFGDQARGIAVIDASTPLATLHELDRAGVRGIRFNLARPAGAGVDELEPLARRIAGMGWHVQVHALGRDYPVLAQRLARLPVPLVIDHIGRIPQPHALSHPAWDALRGLVERGNTWIKLSGINHDSLSGAPSYMDAGMLVQAWMKVAPERMVWGTDWPHVSVIMKPGAPVPDDAAILDCFGAWVTDAALRRRLFVDNPCSLYGFEPVADSD